MSNKCKATTVLVENCDLGYEQVMITNAGGSGVNLNEIPKTIITAGYVLSGELMSDS